MLADQSVVCSVLIGRDAPLTAGVHLLERARDAREHVARLRRSGHRQETLAGGKPVTGVTMDDIHAMNAGHAKEHDAGNKAETLELLKRNSAAAAAAIRALSDQELDRAAPASLYSEAPITCQFMLEDHAVRHSYHHLARIRAAVKT